MFGNNFLTSKYIRRMQQGGNLSVFAPDPSKYRAPLQGINPAVLQYDINTKPLDTSGLIQVLQTKDQMDIAREKAALEREKLKAEADAEKNKLQYMQMKFAMDLVGDMFKSTNASSPGSGAASGLIYSENDILQSPRFNALDQQFNEKFKKLSEDVIKSSFAPVGVPSATSLMKSALELKTLKERGPSTSDIKAEAASRNNLYQIMSGTKKGSDNANLRVSAPLANRILKKGDDYLKGIDNGYQMGLTINSTSGLVFDTEVAGKKFQDLITRVNSPIEQETLDDSGTVITTKKTKKVLSPDLAAKSAADAIWVDANLRSYASDLFGLDLWDDDPANEATIKANLASALRKVIEADDAIYNGTSGITTDISAQIKPQENKTVNLNYNIKGGTTRDETKTVTVQRVDPNSLPKEVKVSADGTTYDISNSPNLIKAANELAKKTKVTIDLKKVPANMMQSILNRSGGDKSSAQIKGPSGKTYTFKTKQ